MAPITTGLQTLDLGKLEKDSKVTFGLLVFNQSEEEIKLTPWAGCGCTTPTVHPETLPAGSTGIMTVIFNTAGKSGVQERSFGLNYKQGSQVESCTMKIKAII